MRRFRRHKFPATLAPLATLLFAAALAAVSAPGCKKSTGLQTVNGLTKVRLQLDWKPEPEFGGFYAARDLGIFKKYGLDVEIVAGGVGTPTVPMVANGRAEFATSGGDDVVLGRTNGRGRRGGLRRVPDLPAGDHGPRGEGVQIPRRRLRPRGDGGDAGRAAVRDVPQAQVRVREGEARRLARREHRGFPPGPQLLAAMLRDGRADPGAECEVRPPDVPRGRRRVQPLHHRRRRRRRLRPPEPGRGAAMGWPCAKGGPPTWPTRGRRTRRCTSSTRTWTRPPSPPVPRRRSRSSRPSRPSRPGWGA